MYFIKNKIISLHFKVAKLAIMQTLRSVFFILVSTSSLFAQTTLFQQYLYFNNNNLLHSQHYQHLNHPIQQADYTFDILGRLVYNQTTQYDSAYQIVVHSNRHNTDYSYDFNGNLLSLNRYGATTYTQPIAWGIMDSLHYQYAIGSNQLQAVTDYGAITGYHEHHFDATDYWYDPNGSLQVDSNLHIDVHYNLLLKVDSIVSDTGGVLVYTYDVNGLKVQQQQLNAQGIPIIQKLYLGNVTYWKNNQQGWQLERILAGDNTSYGVIATGLQTEYNLLDYLGNMHLSVADVDQNGGISSNEVLQQQHYYPYGLEVIDLNTLPLSTFVENPHKYNGGAPDGPIKQRMEEMQLPVAENQSTQSHTFFRTWDKLLGRWHQIDPKHKIWESPYAGMGNNPVMRTDYLGDKDTNYSKDIYGIPYGFSPLLTIADLGVNYAPQAHPFTQKYLIQTGSELFKVLPLGWVPIIARAFSSENTDLYYNPEQIKKSGAINYTGRVFKLANGLNGWEIGSGEKDGKTQILVAQRSMNQVVVISEPNLFGGQIKSKVSAVRHTHFTLSLDNKGIVKSAELTGVYYYAPPDAGELLEMQAQNIRDMGLGPGRLKIPKGSKGKPGYLAYQNGFRTRTKILKNSSKDKNGEEYKFIVYASHNGGTEFEVGDGIVKLQNNQYVLENPNINTVKHFPNAKNVGELSTAGVFLEFESRGINISQITSNFSSRTGFSTNYDILKKNLGSSPATASNLIRAAETTPSANTLRFLGFKVQNVNPQSVEIQMGAQEPFIYRSYNVDFSKQ